MLNNTKIALFIRKLKTFQKIAQSQRFDPKNCRFEGLDLVVSNLASFCQNSNLNFSKPKIIFKISEHQNAKYQYKYELQSSSS